VLREVLCTWWVFNYVMVSTVPTECTELPALNLGCFPNLYCDFLYWMLYHPKCSQFCIYLSQLVFAVRHRTRIGVSSLTSQVAPQLNPSQDAWVPFIVCCRWVGGVAVCSVPGAHPVHLLCSLEVLTHPLTKVAQVYNVLITHWILLNVHCSFL